MKTYAFLFTVLAVLVMQLGCSSTSARNPKPRTQTVLTPDREARMNALVKRLTDKGYSLDRAKRIAAEEVPLTEEQSAPQPLVDVFTGAAAKREAEDTEFRRDLDKLRKQSSD